MEVLTPLVPVVDGVMRWSVWNEPRKLYFNGHYLRIGDVAIVVDPVPLMPAVTEAIEAAGVPALCVITNRDHERAAEQVHGYWGTRVLAPRGETEVVAAAPLAPGDLVAGALRVIAVAGAKTPGEIALHWAARRLLVVGDAAVGRPAGGLSMLADDRFADVAAARAGVARLGDLDVDVVLVGDGEDLLTGGAAALRALGPGPARSVRSPFDGPGC